MFISQILFDQLLNLNLFDASYFYFVNNLIKRIVYHVTDLSILNVFVAITLLFMSSAKSQSFFLFVFINPMSYNNEIKSSRAYLLLLFQILV